MPLTEASDGFSARIVGPWTAEKLDYIQRYVDIFCTAMRGKWRLVYVDLLAGPGVCIEKTTGTEYRGSPLIALNRPEFDQLYFNDRHATAVEALRSRVTLEIPTRIRIDNLDCNAAADRARTYLFPDDARARTLGLAVIDPTAYQITFDGLRELTQDVRLDLIITYMTDHIRRFVNTPEFRNPVSRFLGTPDWRDAVTGEDDRTTYYRLLDFYRGQLDQIGYHHVSEPVIIRNTRRRVIYHIVFASKHRLGADFASKVSQRLNFQPPS